MEIKRVVILLGTLLIIVGIGLQFFGNGSLRLPGDIIVKRENFSFYFPLGLSVVLSVVLSLILYLFTKK